MTIEKEKAAEATNIGREAGAAQANTGRPRRTSARGGGGGEGQEDEEEEKKEEERCGGGCGGGTRSEGDREGELEFELGSSEQSAAERKL